MATSAHRTDQQSERDLDKALEDSFPASDPPAHSGITGAEKPDKSRKHRTDKELPTGTPNSDRYETETAFQSEDEIEPSPKPER